MTTKHSPLRELKAQSDKIAAMLCAAERGEKIDVRFAEKIAQARDNVGLRVGIVMDDKTLMLEIPWSVIRSSGEVALSEYILKQDARDARRRMNELLRTLRAVHPAFWGASGFRVARDRHRVLRHRPFRHQILVGEHDMPSLTQALLKIGAANREVSGEPGEITMSRHALVALAAEIHAGGGPQYVSPHKGFKFDGIAFRPPHHPLPRDGLKADTPITAEAIEGRLEGKPWPKAEDAAKAQAMIVEILTGKIDLSGEDLGLLREFFDSQLIIMAMLQGLARRLP